MKKNTVFDCSVLTLPKIHSHSGNITALNNSRADIPFDVKRVYYLYDVPGGEERGAHGHKELEQLIVAASGSFEVLIDDGNLKRTVQLSRPNMGLYLPKGVWRSIEDFSSGAICLVLASHEYDEDDYIRDYEDFLDYRKELG